MCTCYGITSKKYGIFDIIFVWGENWATIEWSREIVTVPLIGQSPVLAINSTSCINLLAVVFCVVGVCDKPAENTTHSSWWPYRLGGSERKLFVSPDCLLARLMFTITGDLELDRLTFQKRGLKVQFHFHTQVCLILVSRSISGLATKDNTEFEGSGIYFMVQCISKVLAHSHESQCITRRFK